MGKRKAKKKPAGKSAKKSKKTLASQADLHVLYERAVQGPDADVEFFYDTYRELRDAEPTVLREDFCGTAKLCATWCRVDESRRALGVDLDEPTLQSGRDRHMTDDVSDRVTLVCDDVREVTGPKADITCAMNFSYCVFKKREELKGYLASTRKGLKKDGMLVLEIYGGLEAMQELEEERELDDGITYVWDQDAFDPLTHETLCYIHFDFPDGSRIEKAFTYDWRWWSVPELRDLLMEVGYSDVRVFWEEMEDDPDDEDEMVGTGDYIDVTDEIQENQESWLAYVVALK